MIPPMTLTKGMTDERLSLRSNSVNPIDFEQVITSCLGNSALSQISCDHSRNRVNPSDLLLLRKTQESSRNIVKKSISLSQTTRYVR
jgi:hypothetical protein